MDGSAKAATSCSSAQTPDVVQLQCINYIKTKPVGMFVVVVVVASVLLRWLDGELRAVAANELEKEKKYILCGLVASFVLTDVDIFSFIFFPFFLDFVFISFLLPSSCFETNDDCKSC